MPKFRKKPVVIEAVQFTEAVAIACLIDREPAPFGLIVSGDYHPERRTVSRAWISIKTLEGTMRADMGDWIIKAVQGEFYPCKPDIFEETYESIEVLEPLFEIRDKTGEEPCGECHIHPGETCDICGASRP